MMRGNVINSDFQLFTQYFTQSNTSWDEGDFSLLSQNFGATSAPFPAPPFASVPEPTVTGILLVAGVGFLIRRRNDSRTRSLSANQTPLSE
jgi:hypothetical protein